MLYVHLEDDEFTFSFAEKPSSTMWAQRTLETQMRSYSSICRYDYVRQHMSTMHHYVITSYKAKFPACCVFMKVNVCDWHTDTQSTDIWRDQCDERLIKLCGERERERDYAHSKCCGECQHNTLNLFIRMCGFRVFAIRPYQINLYIRAKEPSNARLASKKVPVKNTVETDSHWSAACSRQGCYGWKISVATSQPCGLVCLSGLIFSTACDAENTLGQER